MDERRAGDVAAAARVGLATGHGNAQDAVAGAQFGVGIAALRKRGAVVGLGVAVGRDGQGRFGDVRRDACGLGREGVVARRRAGEGVACEAHGLARADVCVGEGRAARRNAHIGAVSLQNAVNGRRAGDGRGGRAVVGLVPSAEAGDRDGLRIDRQLDLAGRGAVVRVVWREGHVKVGAVAVGDLRRGRFIRPGEGPFHESFARLRRAAGEGAVVQGLAVGDRGRGGNGVDGDRCLLDHELQGRAARVKGIQGVILALDGDRGLTVSGSGVRVVGVGHGILIGGDLLALGVTDLDRGLLGLAVVIDRVRALQRDDGARHLHGHDGEGDRLSCGVVDFVPAEPGRQGDLAEAHGVQIDALAVDSVISALVEDMILRDHVRVGDRPLPARAADRRVIGGMDDDGVLRVVGDLGPVCKRHARRVLIAGEGQHGVGPDHGEGGVCAIGRDIIVPFAEHVDRVFPFPQISDREGVVSVALKALIE